MKNNKELCFLVHPNMQVYYLSRGRVTELSYGWIDYKGAGSLYIPPQIGVPCYDYDKIISSEVLSELMFKIDVYTLMQQSLNLSPKELEIIFHQTLSELRELNV